MHQLADRLSSFFVSQALIPSEKQYIYTYCFESLFSLLLFYGGIFILAIYFKILIPTLWYISCFCVFRSMSGGYHATTHIRCFLLSMTTYLLFVILYLQFPIQFYSFNITVLAILNTLILFFCAPLEHPNNPLTPDRCQKFRKRLQLLNITLLFFLFCLLQISLKNIAFALTLGYTQAAFSVALAFLLKQRRRS